MDQPDRSADPAVPDGGAVDAAEVVVEGPPEARRRPRSAVEPLLIAGVGFAMGTADLVPGFSGGTVALVCGIYQRLVANVRQGARALSLLVRFQVAAAVAALRAIEWTFVLALLAGLGTALIALARLLGHLLETAPVAMSALFLGLVVGATVVAFGELRRPAPRHLALGATVAVVAFAGLGIVPGTLDDPSLLVLFLAGAIAVCAMILPGISGSFLLLLVGVYQPVIDALSDRDLVVIGVVGAGCVVGLASFSTLLNWALDRHHDLVLAALLGLMVGSTRVLWPWPSTGGVGDPTLGAPSDPLVLPVALALGGAAAVLVVGTLARRAATRRAAREATEPAELA